MGMKLKILGILLLVSSNSVWAADIFEGPEEVEVDPELANNPLIADFLNPDETIVSRKPKEKWQRFKSLEEQGINYIPSSEYNQNEPETPVAPSQYSSDPFANRMDYLEDKLGVNKQSSPY